MLTLVVLFFLLLETMNKEAIGLDAEYSLTVYKTLKPYSHSLTGLFTDSYDWAIAVRVKGFSELN